MKTILPLLAIGIAITFSSCGGGTSAGETGKADTTKSGAAQPAATEAAPTMTINESDWSEQDLSKVAPLIHISMKVPKDAKMEKNGNGGVDIRISNFYMLTVSALAVSSIKEAMESDKSLTINNKSYINGKTLQEEENGMIYTEQMNTEANGTKYEPEVHFAYYVGKPDGAFYSVLDARPMDNFSVRGSAYSEDLARKVYAIVKGSAKEIK